MEPTRVPLRLYGQPSELDPLPWEWVRDQLAAAPTYWVLPRPTEAADRWPHPRPVWGVLVDDELHLSVGSPVVRRQLAARPEVTVHLDSGVDVVIVEGVAATDSEDDTRRHHAAYDAKYDWDYDLEQYGPFTRVTPSTVLAWRSAGWAGRESFQQVGRWSW